MVTGDYEFTKVVNDKLYLTSIILIKVVLFFVSHDILMGGNHSALANESAPIKISF